MIILVSGLPGHGKTLNSLAEIQAQYAGKRDIFYKAKEHVDDAESGIAGLQLDGWTPFYDFKRWWELPEGAVIVCDECQYDLPRRQPGKEPQWIAQFAEHRKRGYDLYLITQDVRNMDYFVRRLAGKHIHFWRPFGMLRTTRFEYSKAVEDPHDRRNKGMLNSKKLIKFPRQFFDKYASANVHTHTREIPKKLWMLPASILFFLFFVYRAYSSFAETKAAVTSSAEPVQSEMPKAGSQPAIQAIEKPKAINAVQSNYYTASDFIKFFRHGIKQEEFDRLPLTCAITSTAVVKCTSGLSHQVLKQHSQNYFCTDYNKCTFFLAVIDVKKPDDLPGPAEGLKDFAGQSQPVKLLSKL